jgi:small redox-active disulfide protein 2
MNEKGESMVAVKVLGSGCSKCVQLEKLVRKVVETQGVEARVEKVTEIQEIMKYNILSTPGLVINGKLVSAGKIPAETDIALWLDQARVQVE